MMTDRPDSLANRVRTYAVDLSDVPDDAPVFEGTTVPVECLFRYWIARDSLRAFLRDFPEVGTEQALVAIMDRAKVDLPVVSDRYRLGGFPLFDESRVPVRTLFEYLKHGENIDEFLAQFPTAEREFAVRVLEMASDLIEAVAYGNTDWRRLKER